MLELVESLADYGADYRNFARELLLHLREILLVKLAPADSAAPRADPARGARAAAARSRTRSREEDLLRGLDVLTQAETDLRCAPDPRVTLELALLKLVQMRRLVPFAELVARVERLAGGRRRRPAPPPAPRACAAAGRARRGRAVRALRRRRRAAPAAAPLLPSRRPPSRRRRPRRRAGRGAARRDARPLPGAARRSPQPLRGARGPSRRRHARARGAARLRGASPSMHADEYRELARKAAGPAARAPVRAGRRGRGAGRGRAAAPRPRREQQLREEAEKEPAVQEALDLFDGRVVDVREAKPGREDA